MDSKRTPRQDVPIVWTAAKRIVHASTRMTELSEMEDRLLTENQGRSIVVRALRGEYESGKRRFVVDNSSLQPAWDSVEAAMLSSEVIHHCRTALDYLVYNLAWLDSGTEQKTQFPIVFEPAKWAGEVKHRLPGVNRAHTDRIREIQPFEGTEWTRSLGRFSNADKHNFMIDLMRSHVAYCDLSSVRTDPQDSDFVLADVLLAETLISLDDQNVMKMLADVIINSAELVYGFFDDFGVPGQLVIPEGLRSYAEPLAKVLPEQLDRDSDLFEVRVTYFDRHPEPSF